MERVGHERVVAAVHAAGGVASLAHPGRIRSERVPEMVERLVDAGLDAVEVRYPYGESGPGAYADIGVEEAAALAEEYGLLATGGSDCHGPGSGKFRIGEVRLPAADYEALRGAAGIDG
jgi:predicted metal-dependent phosphoesterase TrpH